MLFTNTRIQTRQKDTKTSRAKLALKYKNSLPQTCSSAKANFQQMKLTQSHQIQQLGQTQFRLNIIAPNQNNAQQQTLTKKFSCPQWIVMSNMAGSVQAKFTQHTINNPQLKNQLQQTNPHNDYSNQLSQETESKQDNFLNVQHNQTQRIMQITGISEHKEGQINIQSLRVDRHLDDLQYKSAFILQHNQSDSDKGSLTSLQLEVRNKSSTVSYKAKSMMGRQIKSKGDLEQFHKQQFQKLSEYGLKPCESNRLKKIQKIEKIELAAKLSNADMQKEQQQHPQYFNLTKDKKTTDKMTKFRKCSAVVQTQSKRKSTTKKSMSKQKHSLSKNKNQLESKLTNKSPRVGK